MNWTAALIFGLKTDLTAHTAECTHVWIEAAKYIQPTKAYGCRGAAHGHFPIYAKYTVKKSNGLMLQNPVSILWKNFALTEKPQTECILP